MPTFFDDEDLSALRLPLLVLFPSLEQIYSPARAIERVRHLLPHAEVEMVSDAGHFVAMEAAEPVDARLLGFLGSSGQTAAPRSRASGSL